MCRVTHTNLSKSCNTVGHMTFTEKQLPHSLMWYCIKFVKRGTVPSFVQIKFNQNQFLHMQLSKWFGSYKSLPSTTSFSSNKLKLCLKIWNCVYRPGTVQIRRFSESLAITTQSFHTLNNTISDITTNYNTDTKFCCLYWLMKERNCTVKSSIKKVHNTCYKHCSITTI